jgi:hypothetical protein
MPIAHGDCVCVCACAQVANNARSNLLLWALSKVLKRSVHLCGDTSCVDLAYTIAFRLGWHAVIVAAVLAVLAPNLLFMLIRSLSQRRVVSIERAVMEANAGKAATYENEFFFHHHPREKSAAVMPYSSLSRSLPASTWRRATYFYHPLDLQQESDKQLICCNQQQQQTCYASSSSSCSGGSTVRLV